MPSRCAPRLCCAGTASSSRAKQRDGEGSVADVPPSRRTSKPLIVRFAKDNPRWGYRRVQGELKKLGHEVSAMTIRDVMRRSGLGPVLRGAGPSWSEFLRAQASTVVACDFFTVYSSFGKTIYVLFLIELSSRQVHLAGCTTRPTTPGSPSRRETSRWRSPTPATTFASSSTTETRSSPPPSTQPFAWDGVKIIKTPVRAPQANAIAERWIKSARTELLVWLLIFGERHLRATLTEYVDHYNRSRPHRSLDLTTPEPSKQGTRSASNFRVHRRARLGGLINEYYEAA
ncbi:MAG: integrase core domain-containing protein [Actinomycetota bacterium]